MKNGRSIVELATEIERQAKSKRDFIASTKELTFSAENAMRPARLKVNGHGEFDVTNVCHEQIASRLGIPQKYYDRMAVDAPDLLETNVNRWLDAKPEMRMVRTLEGTARAFLSNRFRPLDNFDLAETALPALTKAGCKIES